MRADFLARHRTSLYGGLVFAFILVVAFGTALTAAGNPRPLYLCLLFATCASPLLYIERLNGRHAILCFFMAVYFIFYGAIDLLNLFGTTRGRDDEVLTLTELTVLLGAVLVSAGYALGSALTHRRQPTRPVKDWPVRTAVIVGAGIWLAGTVCIWVWQIEFQRNAVTTDFSAGNWMLMLTVLGRMMQPVGVLILAYAYLVSRNRWLLLLLLAVIGIGVVVGFFGDSKELGMRSALLVIIAAFLLQGRIPKAWLAGFVVFAVFAFPVFQAYRAEIIMARGASRADALENAGRSLELALSRQKKAESGSRPRSESFLQRASLKGNLQLVLVETGNGVRFQQGHTIWPLVTVFVPRMLWPDKPDYSSGQLFNTEFHVSSDPRTYISPTHLGELYWNFGWPGILIGMPLIGMLLGAVNGWCDLSQQRSLTRLLILVTTIYAGCVRFEGSIALEYVVWMRSVGAILLLHLLFARLPRPTARAVGRPAPQRRSAGAMETVTVR